ncbi:hypothetical protein BDR06DRAFT_1000676 [Suillus hirtellus]|nr:hypothetical protein BDR06DRAFT_1000676 [Suillus hirtellus]
MSFMHVYFHSQLNAPPDVCIVVITAMVTRLGYFQTLLTQINSTYEAILSEMAALVIPSTYLLSESVKTICMDERPPSGIIGDYGHIAHADHGATIGKPVIALPAQARRHNTSESFKVTQQMHIGVSMTPDQKSQPSKIAEIDTIQTNSHLTLSSVASCACSCSPPQKLGHRMIWIPEMIHHHPYIKEVLRKKMRENDSSGAQWLKVIIFSVGTPSEI